MQIKNKVQVVVIAEGKLLLMQTNKKRGSFWQNITGSVDPGEDFIHAAIRELEEETSIKNTQLIDLNLHFEFVDQYKKQVHEKCFVSILNQLPTIIIDSKEHQSFQWKEVDQIKEDHFKFKNNYETFLKAKAIYDQAL